MQLAAQQAARDAAQEVLEKKGFLVFLTEDLPVRSKHIGTRFFQVVGRGGTPKPLSEAPLSLDKRL